MLSNRVEEEFSEVRQEFIANSSLLARVTALVNAAGLATLARDSAEMRCGEESG
jgi:hypothetical protein